MANTLSFRCHYFQKQQSLQTTSQILTEHKSHGSHLQKDHIYPRMYTDTNLYLISRGISNSLKSIQMTWVHVTKTEAMKLKNFYKAKAIINRVKKQLWMRGNIYTSFVWVSAQCPHYIHEGLPLQQQKYEQSNLGLGKRTSSHVSQKAPQTSSCIEPTKRCSVSLNK